MNEGHLPGHAPGYEAYGYDPYSSGSYQTAGTTLTTAPQDTYDAYDPYASPYGYDAQHAAQAQQTAPAPHHPTGHAEGYGYGYDYDTGYGYGYGYDTGGYALYDPYATTYDTGGHDTTALWQGGYHADGAGPTGHIPHQQSGEPAGYGSYGAFDQGRTYDHHYGYHASQATAGYGQVPPGTVGEPAAEHGYAPHDTGAAVSGPGAPDAAHAMDITGTTVGPAGRDGTGGEDHAAAAAAGPGAARSRRRKAGKRSALLTVAVPSVAVMGVAAVGAAAVTGVGSGHDASKAQADGPGTAHETGGNAPTTQFDRQLAGVSRDAGDFASRASRTQERIDLKDRQAAVRKAKAEAAARKEALRPKFLLPVRQKGLSAYFGQAGVNWMALHTGIDFPVQVGTPVMAVTDGTIRTQWNSSYGNMAIVTAANGTETWYCHLSSTKIRSGAVKAGDVIAYSGNTGNTTGPHLHFEVRPDGGAPIDPLPWLLSHGLDPR